MEVFKKITMNDVFKLAHVAERIKWCAMGVYDMQMEGNEDDVYENLEAVANYLDDIVLEIIGRE